MISRNRSSTADDDWLSKASLAARHMPASRISWFYRLRELEAFAPSERAIVLREVLESADRGWVLVREVFLGLIGAACVTLLLVLPQWDCVPVVLVVAAAFGVPFLVARRHDVRRLLKQRWSRDRSSGRHPVRAAAVGEPLVSLRCFLRRCESARRWLASLSWRAREWAAYSPWS
jgi:hypothetical protein